MAEPGAPLPPGSFDTRVPTVIAVIAFTLTVATAAVGLRIYTRKYIINNMGFDDYFAVFALVSGRIQHKSASEKFNADRYEDSCSLMEPASRSAAVCTPPTPFSDDAACSMICLSAE